MPPVVFVLSAAVFAQGTSEFVLSGLLDQIANDTHVPIGTAGLLTSVFAGGMVIGAPVMALTVSRIPSRTSLVAFLTAFSACHVVAALTNDFAVLIVTRLLAAVANAGFLAVTLASLPALVPQHVLGRATSVILAGVTLACIVGVPVGTLLGQAFGWHAAFWAIAAITAATIAPLSLGRRIATSPAKVRWDLKNRNLVVGVLVNGGTFATFTYLGTMAGPTWSPLALALFGIGSFVGVTLSGRYGDRYPVITAGTTVLAVIWLAAAFAVHTLPGLLTTAFVTGVGAFGVGAAVIGAIVRTSTGALATTAFNVGAVIGPAIAGLVVAGTATAAIWVSVGFTAFAAVLARGR
jgi:DHA1 family chloramphenicol resistance protein-like MFS transporter